MPCKFLQTYLVVIFAFFIIVAYGLPISVCREVLLVAFCILVLHVLLRLDDVLVLLTFRVFMIFLYRCILFWSAFRVVE